MSNMTKNNQQPELLPLADERPAAEERPGATTVSNQTDSHDQTSIASRLQAQDWPAIHEQLHASGFALVKSIMTRAECDELITAYADNAKYRKTVDMRRYRFGEGAYRYYRYDLPEIVQGLREGVYPHVAPVANEWMRRLGLSTRYPATLAEMQALCHAEAQLLPTPLILRYGPGGYNTLHQDLYGKLYFPLQAVFVLNQDGVDFTGGEFVLTEQVPRAQSKARVIRPDRGDMVIFTTNFRPAEGSRGYYQAAMRHGISPVLSGLRYALGVIFHDATT